MTKKILEEHEQGLTPAEFVQSTIRYFRSKGKNVLASPHAEPGFYKFYINDVYFGIWSSIGLSSVLSQYKTRTYSADFLLQQGLPLEL